MTTVTIQDVAAFAQCADTRAAERRHAQAAFAHRAAVPVRQLAADDAISLYARIGLLCHVVVCRDASRAAQLAAALLSQVPHPPEDPRVRWPTRTEWDAHRREAAACAARRPLHGADLAQVIHTGSLLQAYLVAHQRDRAAQIVRTTTRHKFLRDTLAVLVTHLEALP